jgi:DNA-damage-inducible protein J
MAKTASMYLRIDPEVKRDVEDIYAQYGMSVTDAINIFLYQSRNVRGLPFDLRPNAETLEAIREGNEIIEDDSTRFKSAKALLADLKA